MSAARLPALDMARGLAVLAMFAFHFTWDLGHFGYIDADIPYSRGVKLFGHAIGIAFLFIAGVSLTLAQGKGWGDFLRRLARVAGAAGLVTLGTYLAFPQAYVFFGILHCIAAASLLAAPLLLAPWPVAAAAAFFAASAPFLFSAAFFDPPLWRWLGLSTLTPLSNDYRPLLPWAGALFAGVAFGKARPWAFAGLTQAPRPLTWLGRHSLPLYLLHQPLFFAGFTALALLSAASQEGSFVAACVAECRKQGAATCESACACAEKEAQRQGLGAIADEAERGSRIDAVARACFTKRGE